MTSSSNAVSAVLGNLKYILVILLGMVSTFAVLVASTLSASAGPPNFVVIFADDLGYGDIGCFGSPTIKTPNIDKMATEGMRLTSFYAQTVCGPSRAALMTGCYPLRVAINENKVVVHPELHSGEITIAEVLKAAGYTSAAFGKWDLAGHNASKFVPSLLPLHQGFDEFFGTSTSNDSNVALMRGDDVIERRADMRQLTRRYTDEAINFIERSDQRPFFVYLAHTMPHVELAVSNAFQGRSAGGLYGDVVEEIDANVGRILETLKKEGLDENTYVIFTSDNGPWYFGRSKGHQKRLGKNAVAHGGSAKPLRGAKTSTWEGGLRVPCIIRAPGKVPAGTQCDAVASTMDLLPTFARLAAATAPTDRVIDGKDIRDLIHGVPDSESPTKAFYYYRRTRLEAVRSGRWKLHCARPVDQLWEKFVKAEDAVAITKPMLFDLEADIGETNDVAEEHPEVVAELMALVETERADIGDHDCIGENARFFDPQPRRPDLAQVAERTMVSIHSLLNDMVDRDSLARFPTADFRLKQHSSYNRASKTPGDAKGWFNNKDNSTSDKDHNFIRVEENDGRKEWVVMDHQGPGAIVRSWMPWRGQRKPGTDIKIHIYLDGSDEPVLEGNMLGLFDGTGLIPFPLAHQSLRSAVSFFPIPYAKRCKVTTTGQPFFYQFTFREYAKGTAIKTFNMKDFEAAKPLAKQVGVTLLNPSSGSRQRFRSTPPSTKLLTSSATLAGKEEHQVTLPAGGAAIRELSVKLGSYDDPKVTRSVVLKIEFDGKETVWCPIGDFFGCGIGLHPYQGWYRTLDETGTMTCRWVMPYQNTGKVSLVNLADKPVQAELKVTTGDRKWDDASMYFHSAFRGQYPVATRPYSDWNYVTLKGRGVYVGDTLTIMNPVERWWGEGDEKIWVDGEKFPSIFGTGTEDYYAYSWGGLSTDFYEHPFHAQPRCNVYDKLNRKTSSEKNTQGYSTETRSRSLDTMPFGSSLQLDMEVWSWTDCEMAYGVGTYWYGDARSTSNRHPDPQAALQSHPLPNMPQKQPVATPAKQQANEATSLPNVIFVLTDDLGYSDIGCYGATKVKTPHIDALAANGLQFRDFHTAASICSPSRAAFLTGAYPQRAGLYMGINPNRAAHWFLGLDSNEITLAEQFKSKDYETFMVGKWHLGTEPEFHPLTQGFDHYYGMPCNYQHSPKFFDGKQEVFSQTPLDRLTELYTQRITKTIRDSNAKPFFLYYAHNYPHTPYKAGKRFVGSSQDGVRGDVMQELDWGIGQLMKTLRDEGIAENTIVIFTSDNGPTKPEYARPFRGTKYVTFEGGHRVPFIMHWPAMIKHPMVSEVPVHAMDLFPTLSHLIGVPLPRDRVYDGESLEPLISGQSLQRKFDHPFFYYNCENLQAVRLGDWKLHLPRSAEQVPFWDKNRAFTKLIKPVLYNLRKDPSETTDVSTQQPQVVARILANARNTRAELGEYMQRGQSQRSTGSVIEFAPVISHEKDWPRVDERTRQEIHAQRLNRYPNFNTNKRVEK